MNRWKKQVRGNIQRAFGDELVMVGKRKIFGDPFLLQKIEIRDIHLLQGNQGFTSLSIINQKLDTIVVSCMKYVITKTVLFFIPSGVLLFIQDQLMFF